MFFTASSPILKTPVITFVNAPTTSHYLQTSVLSWNRTLYIECCSEISINLVFRSQCYFASTFYSTAYLFRIISFCFLSCILYYVACAFVICLIKYLLTYLLTCVVVLKTLWHYHASVWFRARVWFRVTLYLLTSWNVAKIFRCEWTLLKKFSSSEVKDESHMCWNTWKP